MLFGKSCLLYRMLLSEENSCSLIRSSEGSLECNLNGNVEVEFSVEGFVSIFLPDHKDLGKHF